MKTGLRRTNRECPCPICGKIDWCSIAGDGTFCICMRSPQPGRKQARNGGFIYPVVPNYGVLPLSNRATLLPVKKRTPELQLLVRQCQSAIAPGRLIDLAERLGVTVASLHRLGIGWSPERRAWTVPMFDASGRIVGIHLRRPNGFKFAVPGSRNGLFIPTKLVSVEPLVIAEGATDTAALLDLNFAAVGRPGCRGGIKELIDYCLLHKVQAVVIAADSDEPGIRGAKSLECILAAYCMAARIITPPSSIKDIREWIQRGASARELHTAIAHAPAKELSISARVRHRKGGCHGI